MKLDAKMLNLLGVLVLVAVLGLGLSQVALPMYQGVQTAQDEIESQRQSNQTLSMQIAALDDAENRRGEIEDDVAQMREQLPDTSDSHSALRVIESTVNKYDVKIDTHTIGEPVPFTPQTGVGGDGEVAAPPVEGGAGENAGDDAGDPAPGAEPEAVVEAAPGAEAASTDPKQQVEITLEISVPDESTATAVIDSLREGPRLLLPISARFERGDSQQTDFRGKLTVTLLAFSYEEPA